MRVVWLTARSMNDLCSTTQVHLVQGLLKNGAEVTFVNADSSIALNHANLSHIGLPSSTTPGLKARSLGRSMRDYIRQHRNEFSASVVLVEWRVLPYVSTILKEYGVPWCLIDRSPPAYGGLLSRLQWPLWKKAWKITKQQGYPGCVVSKPHRDFVFKQTGHETSIILDAGVDLALFKPGLQRKVTTMLYHGRLDKNRGVMALILLAQKAKSKGLDIHLLMIGEGDAKNHLRNAAKSLSFVEILDQQPIEEVAKLAGQCHIGLLPMPDQRVWRLASPLKRSEYLGSGLAVFGIDHSGHRLDESSHSWFQLAPQSRFHEQGVNFIEDFLASKEEWRVGARNYAETNLSWGASIDKLTHVVNELNQKDS